MGITFGEPVQADRGDDASIAINDLGRFVCVYDYFNVLRLQTGTVDPKTLTVRPDPPVEVGPIAGSASIAINGNRFVIAFSDNNQLVYTTGRLEPKGIVYDARHVLYDPDGVAPSVAINRDNDVISVHEPHALGDDRLYYHVGKLDPNNGYITWGDSHRFDTGQDPRVALQGNVAVSVHRSETHQPNLYYNVGTLQPAQFKCDFADGVQYYDTRKSGGDKGNVSEPTVAFAKNLIAIEVHNISAFEPVRALSFFSGEVNPSRKKIGWPPDPTPIGTVGSSPSVSVNADNLVALVYDDIQVIYRAGKFSP